jgi:hypothetical protein
MAVRQLQLVVRELDVGALTGPAAVQLLDLFDEAERVCAAGKALVAGRAADTNQWRGGTDRTAADWLANRTGTTAGQARKSLETAERVKRLPRSDEALRSGRLSLDQASAVTDGAAADPSAEDELLNAASRESVRELRGRAERIKAAALADDAARHEAIRKKRSAREWIGDDDVWHLHLKGTKDAGARFMARHRPFVDAEFKRARKEGRREPHEAYAFDGMMAMAEAAASGGDKAAPSPIKRLRPYPGLRRPRADPRRVPHARAHQGRRRRERHPPRSAVHRPPADRHGVVRRPVPGPRVRRAPKARTRSPDRVVRHAPHPDRRRRPHVQVASLAQDRDGLPTRTW